MADSGNVGNTRASSVDATRLSSVRTKGILRVMHVPKLVVSDLDGTLLDAEENVSLRTRAALEKLHAKGIAFVIATGRPQRWMPRILKQVPACSALICMNGALVLSPDGKDIRSSSEIPCKQLDRLIQTLLDIWPAIGLAAEYKHSFAHSEAYKTSRSGLPSQIDILPARELATSPALKLLARLPGSMPKEILQAIPPSTRAAYSMTYSSAGLLEIAAQGVDKVHPLAEICRKNGIEAEDVAAFGDMPNDAGMLKWAGQSYAPENAAPELKTMVDKVIPHHHESGVAQQIENLLALI